MTMTKYSHRKETSVDAATSTRVQTKCWVAHKLRYQEWVGVLQKDPSRIDVIQDMLTSIELQLLNYREHEHLLYFRNALMLLSFVVDSKYEELMNTLHCINEVLNVVILIS